MMYIGKGDPSMQDDYMDFINYVFGFNGNGSDFYKLLPKLYKPCYDPCGNSYVVVDGDRIKAAVGAFDIGVRVCDETLKCRGIGNVAVHPFARSRGYMKRLMNDALDGMVKDGVDFSVLGGRRQRYNYFSFEKGGSSYTFSLNADNMRHCFGTDYMPKYEIKKVSPSDATILTEISELFGRKAFHALRNERDLYDILVSWRSSVYAAFDGGRFVGYAIVRDKRVTESAVCRAEDYTELAAALYRAIASNGTLEFVLPEFERSYISDLCAISEGWSVTSNELYSVLDYGRVCRAFMKLKATYTDLPDGELVLDIDGRAGKERLLLSVNGGAPTVEATDRAPLLRLSHLAAERLLFSSVDPTRDVLPPFARIWLPLPIWMYSADMV